MEEATDADAEALDSVLAESDPEFLNFFLFLTIEDLSWMLSSSESKLLSASDPLLTLEFFGSFKICLFYFLCSCFFIIEWVDFSPSFYSFRNIISSIQALVSLLQKTSGSLFKDIRVIWLTFSMWVNVGQLVGSSTITRNIEIPAREIAIIAA